MSLLTRRTSRECTVNSNPLDCNHRANAFCFSDLGADKLIESSPIASQRTCQLKRDSELLRQKYPAKSHARKVVAELGVKEGLIYLPGQTSKLWEDSDQDATFRQRR